MISPYFFRTSVYKIKNNNTLIKNIAIYKTLRLYKLKQSYIYTRKKFQNSYGI